MDNIGLKGIEKRQEFDFYHFEKDHFGSPSCPGSPTSLEKNTSATSTPATLSPPGVPHTPISVISGSGKRRGVGHRASYKRAHIGRIV